MNLITSIILTSGSIITKPYVFEYTPADSNSSTKRYIFEKYCTNEEISNKVSAVLDPTLNNIVKSENEWYYEDVDPSQTYHWHSLTYDTERTIKNVKGEFRSGHVKFYGTVSGTDDEEQQTPSINGQRYWGYYKKDYEPLLDPEFAKDHVYYISIKNIKYGTDQSVHDKYSAHSGLYFFNLNRPGKINNITIFCVPEHPGEDIKPYSDRTFIIKQDVFNPNNRDDWPCIYLNAYAGDVIDTEFDFAVIDLTELAGVTDEISAEEAKQIIINATGSIKDTYPYENSYKSIGYDLPQAGLRLYLPQYSVDTNKPGSTYMLTASTYIRGRYVNLGCFKFKRTGALACPIKTFGSSEQYFEYIDFKLPDLYNVLYGNNYGIRSQLGYDVNYKNIYSCLNLSLYVVDWIPVSQCYIKSDGCNSGQNSIMITESKELQTELTINYDDEEFDFDWWIGKEKMTGIDADHSIRNYINNIYGVDPDNIKVSIRWVIMDSDDIYETGVTDPQPLEDTGYSISIENLREDFFDSWENFKRGLVIRATVSLIDGTIYSDDEIMNDEFISFLILFTNRILLTQDVFAKLLYDQNDIFPKSIKLDDINMNYNDIHVTNKIENIIRNITRNNIEDTKNHIIQPVFYQTKSLDNIDINVAVTENIALQLDSYKSIVKRFILQIEGQTFNEIGRSANGVIFKIAGKQLPKEVDSGVYYILDQDYNLVTSGIYNYKY